MDFKEGKCASKFLNQFGSKTIKGNYTSISKQKLPEDMK